MTPNGWRGAPSLRFGALAAALTAIDAVLVLWVCGLYAAPLTWDGMQYNQLALNLLDAHSFSLSQRPPLEPTVFRTPGYALFIGASYALVGRSLAVVRVAQFLLNGVSAWLLYLLARNLVGELPARLTGVLYLLYAPTAFLAVYYLNEVLTVTLLALMMLLATPARGVAFAFDGSHAATGRALLAGLIGGAATQVRPTLSLLLPVLLLVIAARVGWRRRGRAVTVAVAFAVGFLAPIVPWTVRNYAVTGRLVPLASTGGHSLYWSMQQYSGLVSYQMTLEEFDVIVREDNQRLSHAGADARRLATPDGPPVGVLRELLVNDWYVAEARRQAKQLSPARLIKSVPMRVAYLWSTCDMSPYRGWLHRLVQLQWLCYAGLVAIGVWSCRRRQAELLPVWLMAVYLTSVHLVFHSEPRYSIPGRPFLLVYAGVILAAGWQKLSTHARAQRPTSSE